MATRINRAVNINGKKVWIHANTEQEYADKLAGYLTGEGPTPEKHIFGDYAWNWFLTYSKPSIETVTAVTYERQLTRYLVPAFGEKYIEDITTDDIQRLFNAINGARATKIKVKDVLGMILDMAVEDEIIPKSPLRSKRIKVTGADSKTTAPYSVEQMRFLIQNIDRLSRQEDKTYLALQALHPMRLEEVLGLKWSDIDLDAMVLQIAARFLTPGDPDEFVIGGAEPLSYQQLKRMCDRIQRELGSTEKITAIRFRTTVLTDLYDQTHDIKATQAAAGHTAADMTLKHYVKGRAAVTDAASTIDLVYGNVPG